MYVPGKCIVSSFNVLLMPDKRYTDQITCAYLYPITRYGYPPDIKNSAVHIAEMAAMGFRSIELEGIGEENIDYLHQHHSFISDELSKAGCVVPVLCVVLPQLSNPDAPKRSRALEYFEKGCRVASQLGATTVLDNGPLLPVKHPAGTAIQRHYGHGQSALPDLPGHLSWEKYWEGLVTTYQDACAIASTFNLGYHMHPCEGSLITTTDSFLYFSQAVNRSNLLFNLDTANQFYFKDNLALSLLRLSEKISYIHISDNSGDRVEHKVPGDGVIQWDLFFQTLRDIGFKGKFAIDIGGAETAIDDIKTAYLRCADWLEQKIKQYSLNN